MQQARHQHHKPSIELYDLTKDPFESENLGNRQEYREKIKEIRAWAERQIGLPPPAVVGQWNMAYEKMLRAAYEKSGSTNVKAAEFLVDSRDYLVDFGFLSCDVDPMFGFRIFFFFGCLVISGSKWTHC